MKLVQSSLVLGAVLLVSACSSLLDQLRDGLGDDYRDWDGGSYRALTGSGDMPTSGTATFSGYTSATFGSHALGGDLAMTANFGTAAVAGTMSSMTLGGEELTGVLSGSTTYEGGRFSSLQLTGSNLGTVGAGTVDGLSLQASGTFHGYRQEPEEIRGTLSSGVIRINGDDTGQSGTTDFILSR